MVYQGAANYNVTISGSMINPDTEIVFMPLHRSIKQPTQKTVGAAKKAATSSKATTTSKDEPGTTIVKIVQAKPKSKKELKKAADKKNEKAKKDAKVEAKVPTKNDKTEQRVDTKQVEQTAPKKATALKENANTNVNIASSIATEAAIDASSSDTSNIVYVGQEEMDSLQAQEYIQQELAQHWAPPAGMRSDLQAIITLTIDFEGIIKQVELTQASGNLLFDTAAKKAAAQITPARWTFGKKLAITFKP